MKQLNLFQESDYKRRKEIFYKGVKERGLRLQREHQNKNSIHISIKNGVSPMSDYLKGMKIKLIPKT